MVTVRFFARIREQLGVAQLELPAGAAGDTVAGTRDRLIGEHGAVWREALEADNVVTAVNHEVCDDDHPVVDGDEVAFYPPVTGG